MAAKTVRPSCSMCHKPSKNLAPGIGLVGKHFHFCPSCRMKQADLVRSTEALRNDPIAGKFMQKWIKWDKNDICRCQASTFQNECYRGDVHVLETPEESGTIFGRATALVHAKCGKPLDIPIDTIKALGEIPSKWEFFNR